MPDTSVTPVRPQTSRKLVVTETTAITSGTTARNEANTNASTTSAPIAPSSASANSPSPPPAPVESFRASSPVTWTGAPATVAPSSALDRARAACGFWPNWPGFSRG
jgi:hypothetical protein